jgi:ElaB/YqjD/DUF883 family membrane-anchored ribosome-binding protein
MDQVNNQDIERNLQDREQTRKALTLKLETLETRMRDNVEKVKQSVRNSTDLKYQVGKRPWVMFGLAVVLGSVAGRIFMGDRRSATVRSRPPVEDNIRRRSDSIWTSIGKLATNMNLDQYSQHWSGLKDASMGAVASIATEVTRQLVSAVLGQFDKAKSKGFNNTREQAHQETTDQINDRLRTSI